MPPHGVMRTVTVLTAVAWRWRSSDEMFSVSTCVLGNAARSAACTASMLDTARLPILRNINTR